MDEFGRDGEDQAGLDLRVEWVEEIGKGQLEYGVGERRDSWLDSVAGKIDPLEEVGDLVAANAECDLENFFAGDLAGHRCVEARASLFDGAEVEGSNVGDGLNVVGIVEIGIGDGDGGNVIESDGLGESRTEVRIGCAAVTREPTGVDI